jgi:transketolase
MLNPELRLNKKIFDDDVEQKPTRAGFGEGLLLAGQKNKNVVALCADLTESTHILPFAKEFPDRFLQMGVAEQNMASVASGLAAMGKVPFIASYAMFSPGRNWEQIRTTVCYNNVPVKIIGAHSGVSVGPDGGTHQATEDIALTRVIPRMVVINPCDAVEAKKATIFISGTKEPSYLRLAREKTPIITTAETPFQIGRAFPFYLPKNNHSVAVIASGPLLYEALKAAKELENKGIGVGVLNLASIKPLPIEDILNFTKGVKGVVTVEEHQVAAGLGGAVAELLSSRFPTLMRFIGVRDDFGQSGEPKELLAHYKMDTASIVEACESLVQ